MNKIKQGFISIRINACGVEFILEYLQGQMLYILHG